MAELGDRRAVRGIDTEVRPDSPRALDEERYRRGPVQHVRVVYARRVRKIQRRHRELVLAREVQRRPARHDDFQPRGAGEHPSHVGSRREHLLEVVEQEEQFFVGELLDRRVYERAFVPLLDVERARDLRQRESGVGRGRQLDEQGSALELAFERFGQREREPRLPGASRPGQREQTDAPSQECERVVEHPLASDQRGRRHREWAPLAGRRLRHRVERRIVVQHGAIQRLQLRPRLETELRNEQPSCLLICVERLRLPSRPVQRHHQ